MCSHGPQFLRESGWWTRFLAVSAAAVLIGTGLLACGSNDEAAYVEANEEVLAGLPVPEGATERSRTSTPYTLDEQDRKPDGYTTHVVYAVPEGTTDEDILRYYVDALGSEWEHCREERPIGQPGSTPYPEPPGAPRAISEIFVRDGATVSVLAGNLSPVTYEGTFEVVIDHNAHRNFCTGEFLR